MNAMKRCLWFVAVLLLAGCAPKDSSTAPSGSGPSGTPDNLKQAPTGEGKLSGAVDVQAFNGGYQLDFYETAASEFNQKNPGLQVKIGGSAEVDKVVRTRILSGTPPDLTYPSWKYDYWAAADEGLLFVLDDALDSPAYHEGPLAGEVAKWRDTFEPTILKLGQKDGHQYVLPYFFSLWGWWYDPNVFAAHGWQVPATYDELLALCEKIKAAGIAPITFQGKFGYYMIQGMLLPWAQSIGGMKVVDDIQNLVPGAWKNPAVLKAAQMIRELRDKEYLDKTAVGLTHTESQTQFITGKAAMIPCGTWLDSEMKKSMPPNAKMAYMLPPLVAGGVGDPTALFIEIEPWMVPVKAQNPNAAVAFFKYMTSIDKAKQFVEQKATLMSIKGSDQARLPETLKVPAELFKKSKTISSWLLRQWYGEMETDLEGALTSLLNQQITPEQFCDRAEAAAQKTREDSSIAKHKL